MAMIMCPNGCPEYLSHDETDARQEWTGIEMSCPICGDEFYYREDYALQSSRVVSQKLYNSKEEEVEF